MPAGSGFDKQPSSRPINYQNVTWLTTTGPVPGPIVCSQPFGVATQHIRVISSIAGYFSIDHSTSVTLQTSLAATGALLPAATFTGEYFTVTPGQLLTFWSTGTSTGIISVTEMS